MENLERLMFGDIYRDSKVLVTGHTGFKGSWLSEWLLQLGAQVYGYALPPITTPNHFNLLQLESRLSNSFGDIRDKEQFIDYVQRVGPDFIFHLAAQPIVSESFQNPYETFETNLLGTVSVLEAVRQISSIQAAVLITSDKCYDNQEWSWGYRETDRLGGADPYSASKACAEIAISSYVRSFFVNCERPQVVSARAGNVIGGGDWASNRLVPDCVKAWSAYNAVTIRHVQATRPWQHVLEPLAGYLHLGQCAVREDTSLQGESFNFGPKSEDSVTVGEVVHLLSDYFDSGRIEQPNHVQATGECMLLALNCDKAYQYLHWSPNLTLPETLRLTGEWYQAFYQQGASAVLNLTQGQINQFCELAVERKKRWAMNG